MTSDLLDNVDLQQDLLLRIELATRKEDTDEFFGFPIHDRQIGDTERESSSASRPRAPLCEVRANRETSGGFEASNSMSS